MKKLIFVILVTLFIALPFLQAQDNADREIARTQKYIDAATKQGQAKIDALQSYIKEFPDTKQKWTKLAYYQLAVEYFTLQKYSDAVKYANQTIQIGSPGDGEEGRLYLIIANSYGVKGTSIFNQETALEKVNKAISFAETKKLDDVLAEAKKLRKGLSGPPPKKMSPEQKIKMHYTNDEFSQAISYYKTLAAADKENEEIHKTYANALFKANQLDAALKEFEALYNKNKAGSYAAKIGEIYGKKAYRNKALTDSSIQYYLEASLLYSKEGKSSNSKAAYGKAQFQLFEKYDFNKKINAYNKKMKSQQNSAAKNESAIADVKREIRKQERHIERNYTRQDLAAPPFERDKLTKLRKKLANLESGAPAGATDDGAALQQERDKIDAELKGLLAEAKKRLGL